MEADTKTGTKAEFRRECAPARGVGTIDVHHHVLPTEYLDALANLGITRSIGVSFRAVPAECLGGLAPRGELADGDREAVQWGNARLLFPRLVRSAP